MGSPCINLKINSAYFVKPNIVGIYTVWSEFIPLGEPTQGNCVVAMRPNHHFLVIDIVHVDEKKNWYYYDILTLNGPGILGITIDEHEDFQEIEESCSK